MVRCCAPSCGNSSEKGFVLLRFPCDGRLRRKWIHAMGRGNWTPTKKSRLCADHFDHDKWIRFQSKLKADAVPRRFHVCLIQYESELIKEVCVNRKKSYLCQTISENKKHGAKCSVLPCCQCYDRGVWLNDECSANSECLMQKYFTEHDANERSKILEYGVKRNEILENKIACLKETLQLLSD